MKTTETKTVNIPTTCVRVHWLGSYANKCPKDDTMLLIYGRRCHTELQTKYHQAVLEQFIIIQ